jgi:hypothetical protein
MDVRLCVVAFAADVSPTFTRQRELDALGGDGEMRCDVALNAVFEECGEDLDGRVLPTEEIVFGVPAPDVAPHEATVLRLFREAELREPCIDALQSRVAPPEDLGREKFEPLFLETDLLCLTHSSSIAISEVARESLRKATGERAREQLQRSFVVPSKEDQRK